ncbi:MAG: transcriptional regulator [Hyphomicrobiales bacterium]|nr:MAG: transcriptional regulator [Hyphomicrobiales bacterium]
MKFSNPNLKHLRIFLAVMETKSIGKAAETVFLSQPATTQAIAKLELSLNTKLFDRSRSGMYVSKTGSVYAVRIKRALRIILDGAKKAIRSENKINDSQVEHSVLKITTTQLNALIAVNETKNFALAGRNVGISQSSLHRSTRDLEAILGITFFTKVKRGIESSKAAEIFAKAANLAFLEMAQGSYEVNSLHNREVGQISMGCMPLARASFLPEAINEFAASYPDYRLYINDGQYEDLLNHLRYGSSDLLIGALRTPAPSNDVIQEEIFSSTLCIVAGPNHPLCRQQNITVEQLAEYPWVVSPEGTPTYEAFDSILGDLLKRKENYQARIIETSSQILMQRILIGSNRLSIISEDQIFSQTQKGTLSKLFFEVKHRARPIGITMRKSWVPTKTQSSFLDSLRKHANLYQQYMFDTLPLF